MQNLLATEEDADFIPDDVREASEEADAAQAQERELDEDRRQRDEGEPESIVASAWRSPEGEVFTGETHADAYEAAGVEPLAREDDAGIAAGEAFVTNTGRFVDRKEAARIAGRKGELAAEDLKPDAEVSPEAQALTDAAKALKEAADAIKEATGAAPKPAEPTGAADVTPTQSQPQADTGAPGRQSQAAAGTDTAAAQEDSGRTDAGQREAATTPVAPADAAALTDTVREIAPPGSTVTQTDTGAMLTKHDGTTLAFHVRLAAEFPESTQEHRDESIVAEKGGETIKLRDGTTIMHRRRGRRLSVT